MADITVSSEKTLVPVDAQAGLSLGTAAPPPQLIPSSLTVVTQEQLGIDLEMTLTHRPRADYLLLKPGNWRWFSIVHLIFLKPLLIAKRPLSFAVSAITRIRHRGPNNPPTRDTESLRVDAWMIGYRERIGTVRFANIEPRVWGVIWTTRLLTSLDRDKFLLEYQETWACRCPDHTMVVFVNKNACKLCWPCETSSDARLLRQMSMLYAYFKFDGGLMGLLTPKTLLRVDVIKSKGHYAGRTVSTLELGRIGFRNVAMLLEDRPDNKRSQDWVSRLTELGVIRSNSNKPAAAEQATNNDSPPINSTHHHHQQQQHQQPQESYQTSRTKEEKEEFALNFVETWDSSGVLAYILTPTILSLLICIVWPVVAVRTFEADVQTSVQTGVAVGSYIVTAGAFLIALLAWYETLSKEDSPKLGAAT